MKRMSISLITLALVCATLGACAPQQQPYRKPQLAPSVSELAFHPGDGTVLPLRRWASKKTHPKAILIALHGFNDYSYAFAQPATYWSHIGIETIALDQRGFGASQDIGIWANNKNLISDTARLVEAVRERNPETPVYLLGASMGGAVAIATMVSDERPPVDGVILVAPALWGAKTLPWFYRVTLYGAAYFVPWYELTGSDLDIRATDNIEVLREMSQDPHIIKSTRVDTIYGLVDLMDTAYNSAEMYDVPTLILYGRNDQVIPEFPLREFSSRTKAEHAFIVYPEGWHMLLRDLQAERVWDDISEWILHGKTPAEE